MEKNLKVMSLKQNLLKLRLLSIRFNRHLREHRLKDAHEESREKRKHQKEKAQALVDAASGSLKPILIVALNTGMRKMEILSLKWEHVDFSNAWIYIEDSKSGKSRTVPINGLVYETLKGLERSSDYVFYNKQTGTHLLNVHKSFKTACEDAWIGGLRLHDLRHTAASKMVEAGVDLVTVKEILGHSSIEMTIRYAHPTPENKRRAVEKLEQIFNSEKQPKDFYPDCIKDKSQNIQSNLSN